MRKKKYLFISNDSKGTKELYESKENINVNSMRTCCLDAISNFNYDIYMGVNKKYASEIKVNYKKNIKLYDAHIYRSVFDFKENFAAFKNLNNLLKNEKIDVIHCNTPIGGFLGRICGHKNKVDKIIYTVHGFHFYKGNNKIKNFIFKNIEKFLAHWTDAIITINKEDFETAQKFKLRNNGKVYFTHGVGIDLDQYKDIKVNINKKKEDLGLDKNDIILISIGDVNKNKNISLLIDIIANCNNKKIKCLVCGKGPEIEQLKIKAKKLNIEDQIIFLGFRSDIKELLKISDIYISTSKREGLPRALMEAMASGLPCIVSKIRGNIDLIENGKGGYCCNNISEYTESIYNIIEKKEVTKKMINYNLNIIKEYDIKKVVKEIQKIYKEIEL